MSRLIVGEFATAESADFTTWTAEAGRTIGLSAVEILQPRTPTLANTATRTSPDKINSDILSFLANFANGNRYYNLTALAGALPPAALLPSKIAPPFESWATNRCSRS